MNLMAPAHAATVPDAAGLGTRPSTAARVGGTGVSRLLRVISTAVVAALILALGAIVVAEQGFGIEPLTEQSNSMAPTLRAGQVLFVRPITAGQARIGEIVTFQYAIRHELLTHRVRAITKLPDGRLRFVTKGDAVRSQPGTETWTIPSGGTIKRLVGRPLPAWIGSSLQSLRSNTTVFLAILLAAAIAVLIIGLRLIWASPSDPPTLDRRA